MCRQNIWTLNWKSRKSYLLRFAAMVVEEHVSNKGISILLQYNCVAGGVLMPPLKATSFTLVESLKNAPDAKNRFDCFTYSNLDVLRLI